MYTISTHLDLPIAHCLYRGAYSGLCCGNVYRDKGLVDGLNDRYDLGSDILSILHGHNYEITIDLSTDKLDCNAMVIDFKLYKKILHKYFDQYDHSMILTPENPLTKIYIENFEKHGIDLNRTRLFIWDENPTAEYMAKYWYGEVVKLLKENNLAFDKLSITVEETARNKVTYTE